MQNNPRNNGETMVRGMREEDIFANQFSHPLIHHIFNGGDGKRMRMTAVKGTDNDDDHHVDFYYTIEEARRRGRRELWNLVAGPVPVDVKAWKRIARGDPGPNFNFILVELFHSTDADGADDETRGRRLLAAQALCSAGRSEAQQQQHEIGDSDLRRSLPASGWLFSSHSDHIVMRDCSAPEHLDDSTRPWIKINLSELARHVLGRILPDTPVVNKAKDATNGGAGYVRYVRREFRDGPYGRAGAFRGEIMAVPRADIQHLMHPIEAIA